MRILIVLYFALISTEIFAADRILNKDLNIFQKRSVDKGHFVYSYEIQNNAIELVTNITFGNDCYNNRIDKKYLPYEEIIVEAKTETAVHFSIDISEKWEMDFTNLENDNSSKTSFVLALADEAEAKDAIKKGRFKLFTLNSKRNADDAYLNQPFCIHGDGKTFFGLTKDEEWKEVDDKLDLNLLREQCAVEIPMKSMKFKTGSSICENALGSIKSANQIIELNCLETSINKNRLKNIESHKLIDIVLKELKKNPRDSGFKSKLVYLKKDISDKLQMKTENLDSRNEVKNLQRESKNNLQTLEQICLLK